MSKTHAAGFGVGATVAPELCTKQVLRPSVLSTPRVTFPRSANVRFPSENALSATCAIAAYHPPFIVLSPAACVLRQILFVFPFYESKKKEMIKRIDSPHVAPLCERLRAISIELLKIKNEVDANDLPLTERDRISIRLIEVQLKLISHQSPAGQPPTTC